MRAMLLVAAHGTRSAEGSTTTRTLVAAVAAARPDVAVQLCFLDVASPSLAEALDELDRRDVVVVPLLLSAGYHVDSDIPAVVGGRSRVRVARHLGPDPAVIAAIAERLSEAGDTGARTTLFAAIGSSRSSAQAEVEEAAHLLAARLDRRVEVVPLGPDLAGALSEQATPLAVAVYLIAEGGFLDSLRAAVGTAGVVAEPIGVHPALVDLIWDRYDEQVR